MEILFHVYGMGYLSSPILFHSVIAHIMENVVFLSSIHSTPFILDFMCQVKTLY